MDGDFHFIKKFFYPEMWKMGLAIGTYSSRSLTYVLYPIFWGSNDFILKKIKFNFFSDLDHFVEDNYLMAVTNRSRNAIKSGNPDLIMEHIDKKIKDILERKKFLFLTSEIAIEHIFDAIQENHRFWKIEQSDVINIKDLKDYLERNYSSLIYPLTIHFSSTSFSNLSTVYHCLTYLTDNNIQVIKNIYPQIPRENDDTYPEYLFNKLTSVYSLIPSTFDAFMYYAFPSLRGKISFWDGFDLISINFIIQESNYYIIFHYFKRLDGVQGQPQLIFTKNFKHELYKNYQNKGFYDQGYFMSVYKLSTTEYKLYAIHGDDVYLFKRKFTLLNQLYNFLIRRFNQSYLKKDNHIFPRSSI